MEPEPLPGGGPDDQEPEGSGPLPADGTGSERELELDGDLSESEMPPGPEQGVYVCLPAEQLTLAGFAEGGAADTMAPGPLLATVLHAIVGEDASGLAALSEDQLIGVISAARRLESRAAWAQLAAIREFAARRGRDAAGGTAVSEFAADELVAEFNLSWHSAAEQIAFAAAVAERLPRTFAALAAGQIHPVHVKIIEDVTRVLSAEDAARADEILAEAARSKTFGQLRSAAQRLVLKLDPDSARRRKEAAKREAHVRPFREESGNAGMVARELPSDEILASWQHVEQRALDLRAAGMPGTLRELRAQAYLDLLQERDSRVLAGAADPTASGATDQAAEARETGSPGRAESGADGTGGVHPASADPGPSVAALVNITVPLAALQGDPGAAGEAAGFGLLDVQDAQALVSAAARHPRTRWCLTALRPDGTAAAHGCADRRHSWPGGPVTSQQAADFLAALRLTLNSIIRGPCDHAQAHAGYRPSRKLQHLVNARNTRCTAPGCSRPAARCDLDHTDPWHHSKLTCPCNLAPLCRHHHRCKQVEGWWLEQPEPGVLVWRTPSGRTYTTAPAVYPI